MGGRQRDMDHLLVTNHEPLRAQSRGIRGQGRKGGGKIMERSGRGKGSGKQGEQRGREITKDIGNEGHKRNTGADCGCRRRVKGELKCRRSH